MDADIHVYLEDGTFVLSAPLTLGAEDSGTEGHDVIYAAAPGAVPVVSGGLPVTGWKVVDAGKNLWSAPAPDGLVNTRQLYVDGVRALRARGVLPVTLTGTATGYTASAATMATWKNPGDIEFVYTGGNALWSEGCTGSARGPSRAVRSRAFSTDDHDGPALLGQLDQARGCPTMFAGRTVNLVGPASVGIARSSWRTRSSSWGRRGSGISIEPRASSTTCPARRGPDQGRCRGTGPGDPHLGPGDRSGNRFTTSCSRVSSSRTRHGLVPSGKEGFSEIQANYTLTGQGANQTQALCDISADVMEPVPSVHGPGLRATSPLLTTRRSSS